MVRVRKIVDVKEINIGQRMITVIMSRVRS
jgi:hypothetical protein